MRSTSPRSPHNDDWLDERTETSAPGFGVRTHVSLIDSVLCYPTLPKEVIDQLYFVAFGKYFQQPTTSWLTTAGRLIHTGTFHGNLNAIRHGFQVLESGAMLLIFPEGVRTYHPKLEPMQPRLGAGILACETQTPIIPMIFDGSEGTLSARHPGLHRCKVRIVVGDPIHPPAPPCTMDDYRAVMDAWLEAVQEMRRQHRG